MSDHNLIDVLVKHVENWVTHCYRVFDHNSCMNVMSIYETRKTVISVNQIYTFRPIKIRIHDATDQNMTNVVNAMIQMPIKIWIY